MTIGANSYGSTAEVAALTRHVLDGNVTFSPSTVPTLTEVETIINRVSGVLNSALAAFGLDIPIDQADAKLACDDWAVRWTVQEMRKAYPHLGIQIEESTSNQSIVESARDFVDMFGLGFKNLGEVVDDASSQGLAFTGLLKHSERSDPDNTSYEQPKFRRGQWDNN